MEYTGTHMKATIDQTKMARPRVAGTLHFVARCLLRLVSQIAALLLVIVLPLFRKPLRMWVDWKFVSGYEHRKRVVLLRHCRWAPLFEMWWDGWNIKKLG